MSQLNELITAIFSRYGKDTLGAIKELFILLGDQPGASQPTVQMAILYAMQTLHEWDNVINFAEKWKMDSFKQSFANRMKRRVKEVESTRPIENLNDQLRRLADKYWLLNSPKIVENVYIQPIILKKIVKQVTQNLGPKGDEAKLQKIVDNNQKIKQPKNEEKRVRMDNDVGQSVNQDSKKSHDSKRDKIDPLLNLTGRPPILKKSTLIGQSTKIKQTISDLGKTQNLQKKKTMNVPSSDVVKLILNYNKSKSFTAELNNQEDSNSVSQASKEDKQANRRVDQKFPPEKFSFGSSKKSSDSEMLKKPMVSPKKFEPDRKIIKIRKEETNSQKDPEQKNIYDFSFTKEKISEPIEQIQKRASEQNKLPNNNFDSFSGNDFKFVDQIPHEDQKLLPFEQVKKDLHLSSTNLHRQAETPAFVFAQTKARKSFNERYYITDQQMKMINPVKTVKNYFKMIYRDMGVSALDCLYDSLNSMNLVQ